MAGIGYGIAVDLDLAGLRARLFCMRPTGAQDFDGVARPARPVARHVRRSFSTARYRLAPAELAPDATVVIYRPDRVASLSSAGQWSARCLIRDHGLTEAEALVALAANGRSRTEMARELEISLNSIKTHLRRVHSKRGVRRSGELVRIIAGLSDDAASGARE